MPHVLVIDDDPEILFFTKTALYDYQIETAASGEEALECYGARPFDAVICDLVLPGIGGFEVIRRLRAIDPNARILVVTGYDRQEKMIASLRENIVDFLPKPFAVEDLRAAVANVLASEQDIEVISAMPQWIELRIPASFQVVSRLGRFFEHLHAEIDAHTRESISTAFRELLNNAIEHGCGGDAERRVFICYLRLSEVILYRITDPGGGFRKEELSHAAISNPQANPVLHLEYREQQGMRPGGFGILCAAGIADELIYSEKGNEVIFARYLNRKRDWKPDVEEASETEDMRGSVPSRPRAD
jgi:DNA-binding response OmpR family regulator